MQSSRLVKIITGLVVGLIFLIGLYLAGASGTTLLLFSICVAAVISALALFFWIGGALLSLGRSSRLMRGLSRYTQSGTESMNAEEEQAAKDIKHKFLKGLETLKKNKVNLYQIPWYLVIGESGVGKTEAIRRGRIDLIHGLHDPGQGKGGTRDMHWWFTANAVLLDTAGRMVFPEHKRNATPAWCRFLDLLKHFRSHCPINGIMLMISAESLLRDDEQTVFKKANKICQEVYAIRDVLDLRFPIYVMVTKCDRIPGFNEFFASIDNCDQMLGWSNPDEDFRADNIPQHLREVLTSINNRRAALLRDRRIESLDEAPSYTDNPECWYAFSSEIDKVIPNLQKYLRTIFPDEGAFAGKRPFMRGIYFTSAMREGPPLDVEIAKKFSIDIEDLPGATEQTTGASYFMRDLFKEKIFLEKGMVTPETNTRSLLWKRKALTLGFGYLTLFAVGTASFWGIHTLKQSIQAQKSIWQEAAKASHWHQKALWQPTIVFQQDQQYINGEQTSLTINGASTTLLNFHQKLFEFAHQPIKLPPVLKPISQFTDLRVDNDAERQRLQRLIFTKSVLHPLYEAARNKIQLATVPINRDFEHALIALIRIESATEIKQLGGQPPIEAFVQDLSALMQFLTGQPAHPQLSLILQNTFSANSEAAFAWPPIALSNSTELQHNTAIQVALQRLIDQAQDNTATQIANISDLTQLSTTLKHFEETEKRLLETIGQPKAYLSFRDYMERVNAIFKSYEAAKDKLDIVLTEQVNPNLSNASLLLLQPTYDQQRAAYADTSAGTLVRLLQSLETPFSSPTSRLNGTIATAIKTQLTTLKAELDDSIHSLISPRDYAAFERLDQRFLTPYLDTDEPLYQHRNQLFTLCYYKIINSDKPWPELVGALPEELRKIKSSYLDSSNRIARSQDSSIGDFQKSLAAVIDHLEHVRMHAIATSYITAAKRKLKNRITFPIVLEHTGNVLDRTSVLELRDLITTIHSDIPTGILELFSPDDRAAFHAFSADLNTIAAMLETFFDEAGHVRTCKISVPEFYEHKQMLNEHFLAESNGMPFPGDIWKIVQLNTDNPVRSDESRLLGSPSLNSSTFSFSFYRFPRDIDNNNVGASKTIAKTWAPLRHVYDEIAFPSADYRTWNVPIWIDLGRDVSQPFFVRFQFDKPLPQTKADWPTLASLGMQ